MPSKRIVRRTVTTTEHVDRPPRPASCCIPDDAADYLSRNTVVRKQDQQIKDDITNKLYRIEMERVKPGFDVRMQTSNFRTIATPRRRTFTPEPSLELVPVNRPIVDRRRYSTAGNLDIYRPKSSHYSPDSAAQVEYVRYNTSAIPFNWRHQLYDLPRSSDPLTDYEIRKLAELKVRGRGTNGHPLTTGVTYLPLTSRPRQSSTPPDLRYSAATTLEQHYAPRAVAWQPASGVNTAGRKLSESQYELDQFENLMKRTFGTGGVNRRKTLMYTAPPYNSPYESVRLSPSSSYSYATLPRSYYYSGRPYYNDYNYSYPYYTSPYAYGSYYPYSSYSYSERPLGYDYGLYSPPTRVTAPTHYGGYYDTDYYGRSYFPNRYTYSYVV